MGIIPIVAIVNGRLWPYLLVLPITMITIAGKTLNKLAYENEAIGHAAGWWVYVIVPLGIATLAAVWFASRARAGQTGRDFAGPALLLCTWSYFLLNFAIFRFAWPWLEWTNRTPNGIMFTICTLGLTALVLTKGLRNPAPPTDR